MSHEVIFMPLAYTWLTEKTMIFEPLKSSARDPVLSSVFSKFQVFNILVNIENEQNYPHQLKGLPDPSKLSVRQHPVNRRIFWRDFTCNTDIFVRRSTVPDFKNCMNDRQTMLFMVELHKWLKRKLYEETMKEASKHVLHPSKRQKFFRTNQ